MINSELDALTIAVAAVTFHIHLKLYIQAALTARYP